MKLEWIRSSLSRGLLKSCFGVEEFYSVCVDGKGPVKNCQGTEWGDRQHTLIRN